MIPRVRCEVSKCVYNGEAVCNRGFASITLKEDGSFHCLQTEWKRVTVLWDDLKQLLDAIDKYWPVFPKITVVKERLREAVDGVA